MRIIVAGLAAAYPLGGVFWDYLQYAQGLTELGHEVLYLEDTGLWCYDPTNHTMTETGAEAARWLANQIDRHLPRQSNSWFLRDTLGATYGLAEHSVRQFCHDAELFLNVSGASVLPPDDLPRAKLVYIDTDPMFSQFVVPGALANSLSTFDQQRLDRMRAHDAMFSYGENIGQVGCLVPNELFDWLPTRQPVSTDKIAPHRVPAAHRRRKLTTIGSWDPYTKPLVVAGRAYQGKLREFLRFRELPSHSPLPLELAMAGAVQPPELAALGWEVVDPTPVSASAQGYLDYLASSYAEWSVAKHAYVASLSGWFSGRTALYLALGVPAIVQDTGFSRMLPTGAGLLAFSTVDEAADAIQQVTSDYARHCAAAEEIARAYFDSKSVLSKLLEDAFSSERAPGQNA